ncbi:MAG: sortase [Clostridia bacterium]|nr:sortase [Clostridia bacterium]
MNAQENGQRPAKKPVSKKSGLLTALCITLVVVGIGVIAYPFALIAIEEYNKNEVVARLERELPIFRADEDFEMLDEAALAAMPVVAVPQWTTEEVAAANALLDGAELLGDPPIDDMPFAPVTLPPIQSTTAAPHSGVPVVAHGDIDAVELGQQFASLPDLPLEEGAPLLAQAAFANTQVLGVSEIDVQSKPMTPEPTRSGANPAQSPVGSAARPGTQGGAGAPQSQAGSAAQAQPGAQTDAPAARPPAGPDTQSVVQAGGAQGQRQPESALLAAHSGLPNAVSAQVTEGAVPFTATPFEKTNPPGPTVDPRTAFQLRDAPPVYYEDFARILDEGNALAASLAAFKPHTEERRQVDSPTELTVASINSQVRAVSTLLSIFETLPSASGAIAPFGSANDPDVIYNVSLRDGARFLASDLAALDQVINQFTRIKRFPRARDQLQRGFDQSVELVDQTLNLLDYMAQQLSEQDTDAYLRSRSACMVGETEAVYLLELPSLKLKIGCFPNVSFEQMYSAMRKGAALYPRVGTPNTNTNISMIGHRAGSAPFFEDLDKLKPGDTVLLHTRGLGSYRYLVERVFVVEEDDWTPMHTLGYPALTLVSCEEFRGVIYGRRIMVHCKLVGIAR